MVLGAFSDADPQCASGALLLNGAPARRLWPIVGAAPEDPVDGVRLGEPSAYRVCWR